MMHGEHAKTLKDSRTSTSANCIKHVVERSYPIQVFLPNIIRSYVPVLKKQLPAVHNKTIISKTIHHCTCRTLLYKNNHLLVTFTNRTYEALIDKTVTRDGKSIKANPRDEPEFLSLITRTWRRGPHSA